MRSESVLLFSNEIVEAPIVLTRLLRMSQIVGGWVRGEGEYVRTGHAKQDVFRDLLETFWDDGRIKIVIFCRFLREVSDCADIASDIGYRPILFTGKTPKGKRDYLLARFDETKRPTAFIAQIGTGSLGISLTAASEAIFYSHSYSYSEFDQACDRLHRIGQTRKVTYYHLIGRDTVDEVVWIALRTKRQVAELVLPNAGRRPIW
jgi:SNF2 family DNA or RNA helicase